MNIQAVLRTDRMCLSLTGLTVLEFTSLAIDFGWNYTEYQQKKKPDRKRKIGGGRDSKIETIEEKLCYILWYMKTYPTFDVASFVVGFSRTSACDWVHELLPILERTLKRKCVLPERKIDSPEEFYRLFPDAKEVFVDGVERLRQRPKKKRAQQKTYSGKKKAHTRKSIIVSDKKKRVLILTKQKSGRRHDKKLADKESIFENIPDNVNGMADTGFIGEAKGRSNIHIPKKKPRGKELTEEEKEMNRLISSCRVVVEHAIGGLKRYRCISEKLRNKKAFIDDIFILLSAGLWNYHLASI